MRQWIMSVSGLSACVCSAPVFAGLLLYEGFDYDTGADALVGQSGGVGWGGSAWVEGGAANGIKNAGVVSAGQLVFSDYTTTGNVGQVQNNHFGGSGNTYARHFAARAIPDLALAPGTDVFVSFLFRQEQNASFAHDSRVSFGDSAGSNQKLIQVAQDQFDSNGPDEVALGYDSSTVNSANQPYVNKEPFLYIAKYENLGGVGPQNATMWVLSASDYDAIKAGGITEAELNTTNSGTVTDTATGVSLAAGDFLNVSTSTGFGVQNNTLIDELRVFTDLADIESVTVAPIPEPASLLLFGVGTGFCFGRRRRR